MTPTIVRTEPCSSEMLRRRRDGRRQRRAKDGTEVTMGAWHLAQMPCRRHLTSCHWWGCRACMVHLRLHPVYLVLIGSTSLHTTITTLWTPEQLRFVGIITPGCAFYYFDFRANESWRLRVEHCCWSLCCRWETPPMRGKLARQWLAGHRHAIMFPPSTTWVGLPLQTSLTPRQSAASRQRPVANNSSSRSPSLKSAILSARALQRSRWLPRHRDSTLFVPSRRRRLIHARLQCIARRCCQQYPAALPVIPTSKWPLLASLRWFLRLQTHRFRHLYYAVTKTKTVKMKMISYPLPHPILNRRSAMREITPQTFRALPMIPLSTEVRVAREPASCLLLRRHVPPLLQISVRCMQNLRDSSCLAKGLAELIVRMVALIWRLLPSSITIISSCLWVTAIRALRLQSSVVWFLPINEHILPWLLIQDYRTCFALIGLESRRIVIENLPSPLKLRQ